MDSASLPHTIQSMINPRVVPMLFGDLPSTFQKDVGESMVYHLEGDNVLVERAWLNEAADEFKTTALYRMLLQTFEQFPTFDQLVLQHSPNT